MTKKKKAQPLFLNGGGKVPSITYGMLRSSFSGKANSSLSYVCAKLLVADPSATKWEGLASRHDTLIPPAAPSLWADARSLWSAYELARLPRQRDLALSFSVYLDDGCAPHVAWEAARAWTASELVVQRSLAATMIAHIPSLAGSSNSPHIHIIATARKVLPWGFGDFVAETNDDGLMQLGLELAQHR